MKNTAYLLIFDGFADWEPALAICEIRKKEENNVVTVGFTKEVVTSMGGLRVIPDVTLDQVDTAHTLIFILPGGSMWETFESSAFTGFLQKLHKSQMPIAAICGATLAIAKAGLLKGELHTSNALEYLQSMVPNYREESLYRNTLAITSNNIITASGVGHVEFASEIIKRLSLYTEEDRQVWFNLFKHGILPEM